MSLVSLGYSIGSYGIDGNFGQSTENAVLDFQADNGLEEDGKVGNDTWEAIKDNIKPIQEKLIEKGYDVGSCGADGIYGYSTVEAVKKFQRNNGLNVDGIAGPNTQDVLFSSPNLQINPILFNIATNFFNKQKEKEQTNNFDFNKIDLTKFILLRLQKEKDEFLEICNKITSNVFNFLKIDVKITTLDLTYTCKVGFLKVTLNAKSGGDFKFEGDKYIFKNSSLSKTEGFILNTLDFIADKIGLVFVPQIKTNIETFKQKVGEAIVNGSVTIKLEFPKLVYEFQVAKKDDFSNLYGTLTIAVEFDFDLLKIAEKVSQKVLNTLGAINGLFINKFQMICIIIAVIGVIIVVQNPLVVETILKPFI